MSLTDARKLRSGGLGVLLFAATISFCLTSVVDARAWRPGQIPNGFENTCLNCHMSAFGGDARNPFGLTIQNGFLVEEGGQFNVAWGPELAAIDSDGDGFTNGEELGDPEGAWRSGDAAPGDPSAVTFPGNPDSHPPEPTAVAASTWASVKAFISKLTR